jgi:hypothetical protein
VAYVWHLFSNSGDRCLFIFLLLPSSFLQLISGIVYEDRRKDKLRHREMRFILLGSMKKKHSELEYLGKKEIAIIKSRSNVKSICCPSFYAKKQKSFRRDFFNNLVLNFLSAREGKG